MRRFCGCKEYSKNEIVNVKIRGNYHVVGANLPKNNPAFKYLRKRRPYNSAKVTDVYVHVFDYKTPAHPIIDGAPDTIFIQGMGTYNFNAKEWNTKTQGNFKPGPKLKQLAKELLVVGKKYAENKVAELHQLDPFKHNWVLVPPKTIRETISDERGKTEIENTTYWSYNIGGLNIGGTVFGTKYTPVRINCMLKQGCKFAIAGVSFEKLVIDDLDFHNLSQKPNKKNPNGGPWAPFFDPNNTVGNAAYVRNMKGQVLQRVFSKHKAVPQQTK